MKIEDAIQQKHFVSEHQKVHINILYSAAWLSQLTTNILKPYGLTWQQFNVLRILRGHHPKPATVKLLTERMIDKMSNASRLVDKLLSKKLVIRQTAREDRRRVDIFITEEGLEVLSRASAELEKGLNFEKGTLTCEEAQMLNNLLDKLRSLHEENS